MPFLPSASRHDTLKKITVMLTVYPLTGTGASCKHLVNRFRSGVSLKNFASSSGDARLAKSSIAIPGYAWRRLPQPDRSPWRAGGRVKTLRL